MSSRKVGVWAAMFAAVVVAVFLNAGGERLAYAQNQASQFVVSSASNGAASTAWFVDAGRRRVTFCRQTSPNGSGDQLLSFACKTTAIP